jgi:hypothetical protein
VPLVKTLSAVSIALAIVGGCSKSSDKPSDKTSDKTESAGAPTGSGSAPAPAAAPAEPAAATVVGPTRSATGALEFAGALAGSFEWKKKDQRSPITCVWDAAKEIGTVRVDVTDGTKLVTLAVDVPPTDVGLPRLEVTSKDLAAPLKSSLGFNMSGESDDEATRITVKFDTGLGDDEKKPDLTIKGTLEVTCPKKK